MADIKIGALAGIPIKEREKCNTYNSNQYLDFDGKTLTLCENQKPTRTWGAISGSADYQFKNMQHIADKGPLPEGVYQAKQTDLQHFSNLPFWNKVASSIPGAEMGSFPNGGIATWGHHRVWLTPNPNNQMYKRKNFSIHGGWRSGSAGCIDLTNQMDDFTKWYENNAKDVPLIVKYK